jgi:hypothetical protein
MQNPGRVTWPDGKAFAFTVFDDTDLATVENVKPVYDLLRDLGIFTTKSVWAVNAPGTPRIGGATCEDPAYRDWVLSLQAAGFEIGSHGASPGTTPREAVGRSLDQFRETFGHDPSALANHSGCLESIYWGEARVDGAARAAYTLMTRFKRRGAFRGHVEGDPLFSFNTIDTLAACPSMPYHDPGRPYVNAWFASSEGRNVTAFNACVSEEAQDRLEAAGSACIMYTHFASGFVEDGRVNPRFRALLERLASSNGWFVPVTPLLDHIAAERGLATLAGGAKRALEWRWLRSKARVGYS